MDLQELTANTHPWTQPSRMCSISPASPLHPVVRTTARLREEAILNRYDLRNNNNNNNKQQENSQLPANEVTNVLSPPDQPCGWSSPGLTDRGCKTPVPGHHLVFLLQGLTCSQEGSSTPQGLPLGRIEFS